MPRVWLRIWLALIGASLAVLRPLAALAEEASTDGPISIPLRPPAALAADLAGRPVTRVDIVTTGGRWQAAEKLSGTPLGQPLTPAYVRAILRELGGTGRYADMWAEAEALGEGALLRVHVLPRRIVDEVRVSGGGLDAALVLEAAAVSSGDDITVHSLSQIDTRVRELYQRRGFPLAAVTTQAIDTDAPMHIVLQISIQPNDPLTFATRGFEVHPKHTLELEEHVADYAVDAGDRVDAEALSRADAALATALQQRGYPDAAVEHRIEWPVEGARLVVVVWAGPRQELRFQGNLSFDSDALAAALAEPELTDRSIGALSRRLREYYVQRGFLDATVDAKRRESADGSTAVITFTIREGARVTVRARRFPCLRGERSESDVRAEIDGVLSEVLPSEGLISAADPNLLDARLAPSPTRSAVRSPLVLDPWITYDPAAYDKAVEHLRALYRSEGYLSAEVGPVRVLRRACAPRSPAGTCEPVQASPPPPPSCADPTPDEPEPVPVRACTPDPARGLHCEPEVELEIPVRIGPRATLWDAAFEGNRTLVESELHAVTGLELGEPVSQLALEEARRRVIERYAEDGYAFAGVEVELELSPDRTRARARFLISEREPVMLRDVVVRGAELTAPQLILGRSALRPGQLYRRSLVRATEERLATLGVFTSVSVDLEDPEVPARQKVAVIRVQERLPQYLDVRPGFSTGEGLRIAFEYGHRNLAERAIQLMLRVQLGYLPPPLIIEPDVRSKFEQVQDRESLLFLLERRNSVTLEFPEIGLGPLVRFGVEGVDLRDISREFAIEKRAALVTLSYRPTRSFSIALGAGLELNEADVFIDGDSLATLDELLMRNPGDRLLRQLVNVPDGLTLAISQRLGVTWDLRDNPVAATSGTLLNVNVEHVNAFPIESSTFLSSNLPSDYQGHFLQYTGRVAGYLRLNQRGMALAASLRFGYNQQLEDDSTTYPDRLFFLGGVDSLRGFPLWSLVPEDIDRSQLRGAADQRIDEADIPIRGGNVLLNPRAELRIPIVGIWQTAVFLDTGNLWAEASAVEDAFQLRYAAGAGLRVSTPVGPLALDYGINLDRRSYEDFGAFHFSIGLF